MPGMSQSLTVTLPGKLRVVARIGPHEIATDQSPASGGDGFAPEPFDLFLASLATCAGAYVASFCRQRGIPTEGISLRQSWERDEDRRLSRMLLEIDLPPSFPEKYRTAVLRAAEHCSVTKALVEPPIIETRLAGESA